MVRKTINTMETKSILSVLIFFIMLASNGCTYENEEELFGTIEPDSDPVLVNLSSQVIPIMNSNCAISGCHVAGVQFPNLLIKANIIANASSIKSRTQSGNMPKGGSLSLAEKNLIKNWVDQGANDN